MTINSYKVEIETLNGSGGYDASVDVTDYVLQGGVGNISEQIDSGDYDIGLYLYSDLTLKLANFDGKFSSDKYSSSIFHYTRDRARVTVTFESDADQIVFKGIINEEATREDLTKGTVNIRVLSQDSILRKNKVAGGLIGDNDTISEAIKKILNLPSITGILGYDANKINVGIDPVIDDVTSFSDRITKDVLDELLNASGSVFRVDSNNDMVVSARSVNAGVALELFSNDLLGRDNIIAIKNYNEGLHRVFNTVSVNDENVSDDNFIDEYGARLKEFTFDFITDTTKATDIATYLLGQFKQPKREVEITVPVDVAKEVEILNPVTLDCRRQFIKWEENRLPLYGTAKYGADVYPYKGSGIKISDSINWKVTGIKKDTKKFEITLRLREV